MSEVPDPGFVSELTIDSGEAGTQLCIKVLERGAHQETHVYSPGAMCIAVTNSTKLAEVTKASGLS